MPAINMSGMRVKGALGCPPAAVAPLALALHYMQHFTTTKLLDHLADRPNPITREVLSGQGSEGILLGNTAGFPKWEQCDRRDPHNPWWVGFLNTKQ